MAEQQIQTVTDASLFENICNQYFMDNDVYIKTKSGDLQIKYAGYSDGRAAFKIPYVKNIAENCLLITRKGDNTLHSVVKFTEKQEDGVFIFRIMKCQIITIVRTEERKSLESKTGSGKDVIFVTNVISDFIIQNTLALHEKRVEDIKDGIISEFGKTFKQIKIFFSNEGSTDARMKHFQKTRQIIFVPDFRTKELENDEKMKFFINNIYAKDYYLQNRKELISEISIPVLCKMKLPYGYIQINNTEPLNEATLTILKKVASRIDETLSREQFFPRAAEKMLVSNVTMNGFGIVFKDRLYIRYFKVNSFVHVDMLLPGNKKASILAIVRNITILENKVIKVGFQVEEIDALSEVHYQEFVDTLNASQ